MTMFRSSYSQSSHLLINQDLDCYKSNMMGVTSGAGTCVHPRIMMGVTSGAGTCVQPRIMMGFTSGAGTCIHLRILMGLVLVNL